MMIKLFVPLTALLLSSGCCQVLGICTSASIHTSISLPQKLARQDSLQSSLVFPEEVVAAEAPTTRW